MPYMQKIVIKSIEHFFPKFPCHASPVYIEAIERQEAAQREIEERAYCTQFYNIWRMRNFTGSTNS